MPKSTIKLLLVEDSNPDADLLTINLERSERFSFLVTRSTNLAQAREMLQESTFDVILTDLDLPDSLGLDTFRTLKRDAPATALIIITGHGNEAIGVQAMQQGAQEYLSKAELKTNILERAICYAMERNQNQQDLIRSERMASVSTLVGGVSHQFNNLHAVISGYLELVLDDPSLDKKNRQRLEFAQEATRKASAITRALTVFTGPPPGPAAPVNIAELIRSVLDMLQEQFTAKGIVINTSGNESLYTLADRDQLIQVVMHVLVNADHALLDRPDKRIDIKWHGRNNRICLEIIDNGCGIKQEDIARIFAPFYTTKGEMSDGTSAQTKVRGVGLGLTLCQSIVEQYQGRMTIESKIEHGTSVRFCLPAYDPQPTIPPPTTPAPALTGRTRGKILVLDDQESIANLIAEVLTEAGHQVVLHTKAREAVQALRCESYDVITLDLQMPDMDGFDVLDVLQTIPRRNRPRVIVLTGVPTSEVVEQCKERGAMAVFSKPFETAELLAAVHRAL